MLRFVSAVLIGSAFFAYVSPARAGHPVENIFKHDMQNKGDVWAQRFANSRPWHGNYFHQTYGQPVALVVPPTAVMTQTYSWGVSRNYMLPIYHQYGYQGMPSTGGAFYATPIWPSSTQQFGVYPVRAPW